MVFFVWMRAIGLGSSLHVDFCLRGSCGGLVSEPFCGRSIHWPMLARYWNWGTDHVAMCTGLWWPFWVWDLVAVVVLLFVLMDVVVLGATECGSFKPLSHWLIWYSSPLADYTHWTLLSRLPTWWTQQFLHGLMYRWYSDPPFEFILLCMLIAPRLLICH